MEKPTVFVIQAPRQSATGSINVDMSSAADFGTVEFVLPSHAQPSIDPDGALKTMREAFERFKPGDYICSIGGDPAGIFLAGLCLPESFDGEIKWLRWERKFDEAGHRRTNGGFYIPTKINLGYEDEEPIQPTTFIDKRKPKF